MVYEKLVEMLVEKFGVAADEITMDTTIVGDLGADSVDVMDLMLDIEGAFNLEEIEEDALEGIRSVGDIVDYISDRI